MNERDWAIGAGIWGSEVRAELDALPVPEREAWAALLDHAASAAGKSRPAQKWAKQAVALVAAVGEEAFAARLFGWMEHAKLGPPADAGTASEGVLKALFSEFLGPPSQQLGMSSANQDVLKGLVWASAGLQDPQVGGAVGTFARRCFQKIREFGAASTKLGNACLYVLGQLPAGQGVVQLSRLAAKVRYPSARRLIERALQDAATRSGQSREDLEELAIPDFGLDADGVRSLQLGDHRLELAVVDGGTALRFFRADGKPQKSAPKALLEEHGEQLKKLKQEAKELAEIFSGQAARIERHYLGDRRLRLGDLRQRYLEHPLVGAVARRLLWTVEGGRELAWQRGALRGLGGQDVDVSDETEARLWHPLDTPDVERLLVWRDDFAARGVQQPFPQLWRETYRPADDPRPAEAWPLRPQAHVERRFVGHVILQHPFLNLCQQRGWRYLLQGYWDSFNAPLRTLPRWDLVAELVVEPVQHARDAQYIFNYLVCGELRVYRGNESSYDATPLEMASLPPVVVSELLREVDLLVSASSVANDPHFLEGGGELSRDWLTYWTRVAWGELSPIARTRRDVLAGVLSRTALRDRAHLEDRWLVIDGDPAHRIHLGSGHVQRGSEEKPVPVEIDRKAKAKLSGVLLPFEGDGLLLDILARAFRLAG